MPNPDFALKLDLVLRKLSMSRGRLAAEIKVDKSVVGRWVAGTVAPSAHNLSALTSFIAAKLNGFTMLDWNSDLASFTELLGIDRIALPRDPPRADPTSDLISAALLEIARRDTERRGKSYEGFYRATFASTSRPGCFIKEAAIIKRRNGLLHLRLAGQSVLSSGWLFPVGNMLYGVLDSTPDDAFVFLVLNGLPMRHVEVMDGLFMAKSGDVSHAPWATPICFEFLEGLRQDGKSNDARFSALKAESGFLEASEIRDELKRHLLPDVGPAAAAAGTGDLILRLPPSRSLSRGRDIRD